ncbi:MAG TPA: thioredoxin domain-containing protein [bacterium]|jgi:protein-disulfide isomerase|nr:thioredoxin domain-containing protein [bacterium]HOG37982.1 thioredoxin domain-containing protein [bacterium]HQI03041.1 thioredoxin domain-containing protein [bacterium]
MNKQDKIISIIVMIFILIGLSFLFYNLFNFYKIIKIKNEKQIVETTTQEKYLLSSFINDPIKGERNTQVSIYLFTDYETSETKNILNIIDEIIKKYPKDVNLVWKDLPLSTNIFSKGSALAARCSLEQDKYWEYNNELLNTDEKFSLDLYKRISEKLKMDTNKFVSCYSSQKYLEDIDNNIVEAYVLKVEQIPTIFINQQKFEGEITQENLENIIKSIIK